MCKHRPLDGVTKVVKECVVIPLLALERKETGKRGPLSHQIVLYSMIHRLPLVPIVDDPHSLLELVLCPLFWLLPARNPCVVLQSALSPPPKSMMRSATLPPQSHHHQSPHYFTPTNKLDSHWMLLVVELFMNHFLTSTATEIT